MIEALSGKIFLHFRHCYIFCYATLTRSTSAGNLVSKNVLTYFKKNSILFYFICTYREVVPFIIIFFSNRIYAIFGKEQSTLSILFYNSTKSDNSIRENGCRLRSRLPSTCKRQPQYRSSAFTPVVSRKQTMLANICYRRNTTNVLLQSVRNYEVARYNVSGNICKCVDSTISVPSIDDGRVYMVYARRRFCKRKKYIRRNNWWLLH